MPHRFVLELRLAASVAGQGRAAPVLWRLADQWNLELAVGLSALQGSGVDNSASFTGNDLADVVSTPFLTDRSRGQKIRKWFSTEAFKVNARRDLRHIGTQHPARAGTVQYRFLGGEELSVSEHLLCSIALNCSTH